MSLWWSSLHGVSGFWVILDGNASWTVYLVAKDDQPVIGSMCPHLCENYLTHILPHTHTHPDRYNDHPEGSETRPGSGTKVTESDAK